MIKKQVAKLQLLTDRPVWKALAEHHRKVCHLHLLHLFVSDPLRGKRLSAEAAGVYLG